MNLMTPPPNAALFLQHVVQNHVDVVKQALSSQPELLHAKTTDNFRYTALHRASQLGHVEMVKVLLENGANIHEVSQRMSWKALLLAAKHGHTKVVELLLNAGDDVNVQLAYSKNRFTSLHFACQYGHIDLARMLITKYKARLDITSANGLRPIHTAANFGFEDIVTILLDAGEDVETRHNSLWRYTPLHWAVQENKYQTAQVLLARGANVNAVTGSAYLTPLLQCATKNFPRLAQLLIDHNANHLHYNKLGLRAVHVAASQNHVDTLRVILDAFPFEIHSMERGERSLTPLRFAVIGKAADCVRELINRGAITRGILAFVPNNSPEILAILKDHESKIIARRGRCMLSCVNSSKFVDIAVECIL